jgi:outer membrane protein W
MMKKYAGWWLVGVLYASAPLGATAQQWLEGAWPEAEPYLAERLEVGLRIAHFSFVDPERRTLDANGQGVGGYTYGISTYSMSEQQNYTPTLYARYYFNDYFGIQVAWEYLEGRTKTRDVQTLEPYDHSNGNPRLRGPSFVALGRYPLQNVGHPFDMITPYAGVGVVLFSGSFLHDFDWHANGRRNMEVDDTTGWLGVLGTSIALYEGWTVDLEMNYVRARPDARYWMRGDQGYRAEWQFPMDSWVFQAGVKYAF